jgi:hypothetical protein
MSSSQVIENIGAEVCGSCGAEAPHTPHTHSRASEAARMREEGGGFVVQDELSGLQLVLHRTQGEWWLIWTLMAGRGSRFASEEAAAAAARRWERTIGAECVVLPV